MHPSLLNVCVCVCVRLLKLNRQSSDTDHVSADRLRLPRGERCVPVIFPAQNFILLHPLIYFLDVIQLVTHPGRCANYKLVEP